ncbi:MAG: unnamed protein product [uncultured Paraburkholderia sp.]|nr:MAG: unnamed protein product [uncultured Paraburkholderia sp.]CAH2917937.1 MAG: unnamed protein product [uncultured Paraburkholderia sp.]
MKLAASNQVLCRFRFDDHAVLSALADKGKSSAVAQAHPAISLWTNQFLVYTIARASVCVKVFRVTTVNQFNNGHRRFFLCEGSAVLIFVGTLVTLLSVFGGYTLAGGHLGALCSPLKC